MVASRSRSDFGSGFKVKMLSHSKGLRMSLVADDNHLVCERYQDCCSIQFQRRHARLAWAKLLICFPRLVLLPSSLFALAPERHGKHFTSFMVPCRSSFGLTGALCVMTHPNDVGRMAAGEHNPGRLIQALIDTHWAGPAKC